MAVIAHISDLHLDGGDRAAGRARRVLDVIRRAGTEIDAVLVSGDIADHGAPAEYEEARKLLDELPVRTLVLPGNHDLRPAFAAGLLDRAPLDTEINQLVYVAGIRLLLCDSTIPGETGGRLSDATLDWIDDALADGDAPALITFHHPPPGLGYDAPAAVWLMDDDRLAAVLERHPDIVAVLCGHAHTSAVTTFAGRPLVVAPGVVSTANLPFEGIDWDTARDLPPGLAFHLVGEDGHLVTHFRLI